MTCMRRKAFIVYGLLAIFSLLALSACQGNPEEPVLPFVSPEPVESIVTISLYFANDDASGLALERRDVARKNEPLEALVLRELIRGPVIDGGMRTMPAESRVISIQVVDRIAYANFSRELVTRHPGGSTGEQLTISSIVYSLTELPGVEKVQLLLEGEKVESLFGHLMTLEPIGREVEQPHQGSVSTLEEPGQYWTERSQHLAGPVTAVAMGNVMGNSHKDIVAAAGGELYIFAHGQDGYRLVWQMAFDRYVTGITIAGLTENEKHIVVVGAASGNWNPNVPGFLSVFSFRDGHLSKQADISKESMPFWSVATMDLEGNSYPEILATNGDGLYVFSFQDDSPLRQLHHLSRFAGTASTWQNKLAWRDSNGTQLGLFSWDEGRWHELWRAESQGEWLEGTPAIGIVKPSAELAVLSNSLSGDYIMLLAATGRGAPVPEVLIDFVKPGQYMTSPVIGVEGVIILGQDDQVVVLYQD